MELVDSKKGVIRMYELTLHTSSVDSHTTQFSSDDETDTESHCAQGFVGRV